MELTALDRQKAAIDRLLATSSFGTPDFLRLSDALVSELLRRRDQISEPAASDWPDGDTARDQEAARRIAHSNLDAPVFGDGARPVEGEPIGELHPVGALPGHTPKPDGRPWPPEWSEFRDVEVEVEGHWHRAHYSHNLNLGPAPEWRYEATGKPVTGAPLWRPAPPDEPPSELETETHEAIGQAKSALLAIRAVVLGIDPRQATPGDLALAQLGARRLTVVARDLARAAGLDTDPS